MNLIPRPGDDFWRGRRALAALALLLDRFMPPLRRHFRRVFRRREEAFRACVERLVVDASRPVVKWRTVIGTDAPAGGFFMSVDDSAPEVRYVNDACRGEMPPALWKGRLTGRFPFDPREQKTTGYETRRVPGGQRFTYPASHPLRWVMLVSRKKLPPVYALEFDYTPHTAFREQLQFDFLLRSLHQRLRFMLRHNERFVFSVIDGGFFAPDSRSVPFSFRLGETVRVRFEIVRDVFVLIIGGKVVMSVRTAGVSGRGDERCALIFYDQEPDVLIDFEIANLVYEEPVDGADLTP